MGYSIRLLKEKDLENGFLETLKDLTIVGDIAEDIERAKQIFRSDDNHKYTLVAINEKEEVVGSASVLIEQKFIHNGSCVGHIEDVVVKNTYRKQGIGRELIEECIEIAKNNNCYKIILDCDVHNQDFYSKLGFYKKCICMRFSL